MLNKRAVNLMTVAAGLLVADLDQAEAVSFDFASLSGASIYFDGGSGFEFISNVFGKSFAITTGGAAGLEGHITGTYTIGTVTTFMGVSTAPVTGSGTFLVDDGGDLLTADISWSNMVQAGVGSTLNFLGSVNMSNINYTGSNSSLQELRDDGAAINTVTFQFTNVRSLSALKATENATSFSGSVASVAVPDGGSTAVLLSLGFVGLGAAARRRR